MTVVVGYKSSFGGILISDSRATWRSNSPWISDVPEDRLQKILPLGSKLAVGFAGDVKLAEKIIKCTADNIQKKKLDSPFKSLNVFARTARYFYLKDSKVVGFITAGISKNGKIYIWSLEAPNFSPLEINDGFEVIGSGRITKNQLIKNRRQFEQNKKSLKDVADSVFVNLSHMLGSHQVDSVGGMLQIILIEPDGIKPMRYGFVDVDPERPPNSKLIEMKNGQWIQHDLTNKVDITLVKPSVLVSKGGSNLRFYDFEPPKDSTHNKWHLSYFLSCLGSNHSVGILEFHGVATMFGKKQYPLQIGFQVSIGLWGSPGDHKIRLVLVKKSWVQILHETSIHIEYLPEMMDLNIPVQFEVKEPGLMFLEFYIADSLLGRRALYFHQIESQPNSVKHEGPDEIFNEMNKAMRSYTDNALGNHLAEVIYFVMCEKSQIEGPVTRFEGQFQSVYWKRYPLNMRTHFSAALRLMRGRHKVALQLANASTRRSDEIANLDVISNSSCLITPIEFNNIGVHISEPGIYFVYLLVGSRRISTILFAAEIEEAKFSYSLLPEQKRAVLNGELLCLLNRSASKESNV